MKNLKKVLAKYRTFRYTISCCDMIARKREVAVQMRGFSVERMSS